MKPAPPVRLVALVCLSAAASGLAQLPEEPEHWGLRGSVGFSAFSSTDTPITAPSTPANTSTYNTLAGDLRLELNGYVKDPKLLIFDLGFAGQLASNSAGPLNYDSTFWSPSGNAIFLPKRSFPLRVFYANSLYDQAGSGFTSNNKYSLLGVEWTLRAGRLPHVDLSFNRQKNEVRFPTSLTNVGYDQTFLHASADDNWKGWFWRASFDANRTLSSTVGVAVLDPTLKTTSTVPSFNLTRSFWSEKGLFNLYASDFVQDNTLGLQSAGRSKLLYLTSNVRLQHTSKLSTQYSYSYGQSQVTGVPVVGLLPGGGTALLSTPRLDTNNISAGVYYQLLKSLRVFEQFHYNHSTPLATTEETISSLTESVSGVDYQQNWRGFQFNGEYAGDLQFVGTNHNHSAHTFSNNFRGRVGWGDPRRIHLSAGALANKQNYIAQLGAFANNREFNVAAESNRLRIFRIYARAERLYVEVLNPSGKLSQSGNNFELDLSNRRLALGAVHGLTSGVGALFPPTVTQNPSITTPLPIELLIPTPLLNSTGKITTAYLTYHLRRLQLSADWRQEKDLLATSNQNYRVLELNVLYRVGKVTVEGALGNYRTEVTETSNNTGLRVNRYYIRVARDFKIF